MRTKDAIQGGDSMIVLGKPLSHPIKGKIRHEGNGNDLMSREARIFRPRSLGQYSCKGQVQGALCRHTSEAKSTSERSEERPEVFQHGDLLHLESMPNKVKMAIQVEMPLLEVYTSLGHPVNDGFSSKNSEIDCYVQLVPMVYSTSTYNTVSYSYCTRKHGQRTQIIAGRGQTGEKLQYILYD
jgi:hypothetical protein